MFLSLVCIFSSFSFFLFLPAPLPHSHYFSCPPYQVKPFSMGLRFLFNLLLFSFLLHLVVRRDGVKAYYTQYQYTGVIRNKRMPHPIETRIITADQIIMRSAQLHNPVINPLHAAANQFTWIELNHHIHETLEILPILKTKIYIAFCELDKTECVWPTLTVNSTMVYGCTDGNWFYPIVPFVKLQLSCNTVLQLFGNLTTYLRVDSSGIFLPYN